MHGPTDKEVTTHNCQIGRPVPDQPGVEIAFESDWHRYKEEGRNEQQPGRNAKNDGMI